MVATLFALRRFAERTQDITKRLGVQAGHRFQDSLLVGGGGTLGQCCNGVGRI